MEFISKSEKETGQFAEKLAKQASRGEIFALFGDLGSGKTTFSKYFGKSLGVKEEITSPTFVILKRYKTKKNRIKSLIHIDCYRLQDEKDLESTGFTEYLSDPNAVFLVEWPEKIWSSVKKRAKKIKFTFVSENERKIELE